MVDFYMVFFCLVLMKYKFFLFVIIVCVYGKVVYDFVGNFSIKINYVILSRMI